MGTTSKLPRVILADDHTILVEAFRKLLEPTCEVVATVADGMRCLKLRLSSGQTSLSLT